MSRQEEHGAALSHRQNLPLLLTSSLAPRDTDLALRLFIFFTHSLALMLSIVCEDVFGIRETPRHGKTDRHLLALRHLTV